MKVLVIGGCGFIGSHIVDRLLAHGHSVKVFDRQAERFRPPLGGVEYIHGSFGDTMAVIDALAGVDAVMHLVSTTFPGTADVNPTIDVQDNLIRTLSLLDAMIGLGIRRILFLSSGGTVYGHPDEMPIPETHPLRPINSYGIVKAAIEHYLEMYRRTRGISPIAIRASNPYGPRQAHTGVQGVISTFLSRLRDGETIEIWGDGSVVRDYVHVADLAELCARAIVTDKIGPYNAGSGKGTSLREIVEILAKVTGQRISPIYKSARTIDVAQSVLDVSRARADFGWESTISLLEGIELTYEWLRAVSPSGSTPSVNSR
ncbi:NAD-dependent epimerase/dehydratase family protein [Nordella sp. HKS 07]|uniref:NAD-dependent epimerase/dehydratase family protein n=1 Tax=Nordella sp. HKS 07 TaxID=2712222 RepID=UPI0013E10C49|nr:NAD-dependent epimerase/dehydratase family protein [Nordella sp. HKS 07]QIG48826.1 NAD-dependent epimerase/dehydratase family protein [Nordella sp. HKS 07]